jgi:hypothetical protein
VLNDHFPIGAQLRSNAEAFANNRCLAALPSKCHIFASVNPVDAQTCFARLSVRWPVATQFASTGSRAIPARLFGAAPGQRAPTRRRRRTAMHATTPPLRTTQSSCWCRRTCLAVVPASESCPALPDLPERKPVSPGLACGAFLFDDPSLGHLPEVIAAIPARRSPPVRAPGRARRLATRSVSPPGETSSSQIRKQLEAVLPPAEPAHVG